MSRSTSVRRGVVAAIAAGSMLVALPAGAGAATPAAGYFSGDTVQPKLNPADPAEQPYAGSVDFKVFKYKGFSGTTRKLLRVGADTKLRCASGEVKEDRYLGFIIFGGNINKRGKFKYVSSGFTIQGRFTSKTSAKGTLSRTVGDCKVSNVSWTAKRGSNAPIPIPQTPVPLPTS
jgi:hypothetical protein